MILKYGDHGYRVESLQRDLVRAGHDISVDGWFGENTEAAVRQVQFDHGLVLDGIAGPKTREALHKGTSNAKALRQLDLVLAAEYLGVEVATIMAVNEIESRGSGFHPTGEPVILFERHIMRRRLISHGINPVPYQQQQPNIVNDRAGGYFGGIREHDRLVKAYEIHVPAALESASWGLFQIMGFHWPRLGYDSATAFVTAMRQDEAAQLDAFVRFIEFNGPMHAALKRLDWRDFARRYNGPAYAKNDYDTRLAAAYRRHSQHLEIAA
ncbi:Putative peptidoglycan binding domain-containing protein [Modicisalibacter ilicicola DSM 19980]|uniref:Putative peptidoglycan binding domain-containing protein n=1 Tax=Modicisalibacter ilicicola DSM 19980 TaxID=1121942 RepID=A0A1M4Y487_9GAMM|nr:N-acetylmuramidase family protein [Halomonas ilicicola]SHF00525.1 Putative peptidoglycan binding domain-containing protein [Halomonas ilicicola DSM 19980]